MKKITILVCSTGKNVDLANTIEAEAKIAGFDTDILNLATLNLPLYTEEQEKLGIPELANNLSNKLIKADSLIVIAPEYNGSIPPCLNNAIAWISRTGDDWRSAFNAKPTLIATHSGGGGTHVLMAMRQQLSYIGANVLGRQIVTNSNKKLSLKSLNLCLEQL